MVQIRSPLAINGISSSTRLRRAVNGADPLRSRQNNHLQLTATTMSHQKVDKGDAQGDDKKPLVIIVNGREKTYVGKEITFAQVVALADNLPTGPNILYTVTYRKAEEESEGTLVPGKSVKLKNGTTFNVTATDKS